MQLYLANVGVPYFSSNTFYAIILLIPIIAIEAYIHKKVLKIGIKKALFVAGYTNIISTLVGFFFFLFLGLFLTQITQSSVLPGMIFVNLPGAIFEMVVTLIPMFFLSVFIERAIAKWELSKLNKNSKALEKSFFWANIYGSPELIMKN